ncbi:GNAT family N-acetyltransferase [Levilactobacillus brevis]|uniref:GNAT family N-acetyltransferase n=1 Tax=Levilactobacillus brevis TaxID=1580 RepID=UPI0039E41DBF
MKYLTRLALMSDCQDIKRFYMEALPHIDSGTTSWIPGVYPNFEDAQKAVQNNEFFVCSDEEGRIVGSVILNTDADKNYKQVPWSNNCSERTLVVHTLITHPQMLNRGIATQIIQFIKTFSAKNSVSSIHLDTLVNNMPARKLYEKNDFSYVGRYDLPSFDNKGTDDCVFYEFQL